MSPSVTTSKLQQSSPMQARQVSGISSEIFKLDGPHALPTAHVAIAPKPHSESAAETQRNLFRSASANAPLAIRKRFYPAQWRKVTQPRLDALAANRGLALEWIGWDRSLPRLYLPLDGLTRVLTEAIDGITGQVAVTKSPANERLRPISLRVSSQTAGSSGSLILVLEHDRWHCQVASQAALNSTSALTSAEVRFDRVRRQVFGLGGAISVSAVPGGGSRMRIALPIDEPRALVKAWLDQRAEEWGLSDIAEQSIYLFIVGRKPSETPLQLLAADQRLQSLVEREEMIYRTAADRWLWLRTLDQLPAFARTDAWLTQRVAASQVHGANHVHGENSATLRWQLAGSIARNMQRLIGSKVAPLDSIVNGIAHQNIRPPHHKSTASPSVMPPIASAAANRSAKARWRYPI